MQTEGFIEFLKNDKAITSKDKAVSSRKSQALEAEKKLNLDLDTVVADDDLMYRSLIELKESDRHGNTQNAVRKYYEFINGRKFPRLRQHTRK